MRQPQLTHGRHSTGGLRRQQPRPRGRAEGGPRAADPRRATGGPAGGERPRPGLDVGADRPAARRHEAGGAQEARRRPRAAPAEGLTVFERFTPDAREVVVAQEEARALRPDAIGSEHLLLSLLRLDTPTTAVLRRHELEHDAVAEAVAARAGGGDLDGEALRTLG